MTAARKRGWMAAVFLVTCAAAQAIWPKYSPFPPSRAPKPLPHTPLTSVRTETWSNPPYAIFYAVNNHSAPAVRIDEADGFKLTVRIATADGGFVPKATISGSVVWPPECAIADLNGDGRPDYVVVSHSGGCGLAAEITGITFLLSSPNDYVAQTIYSFDASPDDVVDLNGDGRPEFVHCMYVRAGPHLGEHAYWVYNLLGFSGTDVVSANASSAEFPKWVNYFERENHEDLHALTAEERETAWRATWLEILSYDFTAYFPDVDRFAKDQRRNGR